MSAYFIVDAELRRFSCGMVGRLSCRPAPDMSGNVWLMVDLKGIPSAEEWSTPGPRSQNAVFTQTIYLQERDILLHHRTQTLPIYLWNEIKAGLMKAAEHEIREWVRYDGEFVEDPHPELQRPITPFLERVARRVPMGWVPESYNPYANAAATITKVDLEKKEITLDAGTE